MLSPIMVYASIIGGGGVGFGEGGGACAPNEEDVSVQKKNKRIICTAMVWGVSMDHTTVMLTDQIRKPVCLTL